MSAAVLPPCSVNLCAITFLVILYGFAVSLFILIALVRHRVLLTCNEVRNAHFYSTPCLPLGNAGVHSPPNSTRLLPADTCMRFTATGLESNTMTRPRAESWMSGTLQRYRARRLPWLTLTQFIITGLAAGAWIGVAAAETGEPSGRNQQFLFLAWMHIQTVINS